MLAIRTEQGRELLDAGASGAFAVADHQVAHVYVNDRSAARRRCGKCWSATPGVARVLDGPAKHARHLDHTRAGTFVALAEPGAWFTYYYWLDDAAAPDFARTVDIHRKPGYDPVELFLDPALRAVKARVAAKLLRRKLGFRGAAGRDPAGRDAGEGVARPAGRVGRRGAAADVRHAGGREGHDPRRDGGVRDDPGPPGLTVWSCLS